MSKSEKPAKKPAKKSQWAIRAEAILNLAQCKQLNPHFRVVIAFLISTDNNKTGVSYHSQEETATSLHMSRWMVFRAIEAGKAINLLETVAETKGQARSQGIKDGRGRTISGAGLRNFYQVHYGHDCLNWNEDSKDVHISPEELDVIEAFMTKKYDKKELREAFCALSIVHRGIQRDCAPGTQRDCAPGTQRDCAPGTQATKPFQESTTLTRPSNPTVPPPAGTVVNNTEQVASLGACDRSQESLVPEDGPPGQPCIQEPGPPLTPKQA